MKILPTFLLLWTVLLLLPAASAQGNWLQGFVRSFLQQFLVQRLRQRQRPPAPRPSSAPETRRPISTPNFVPGWSPWISSARLQPNEVSYIRQIQQQNLLEHRKLSGIASENLRTKVDVPQISLELERKPDDFEDKNGFNGSVLSVLQQENQFRPFPFPNIDASALAKPKITIRRSYNQMLKDCCDKKGLPAGCHNFCNFDYWTRQNFLDNHASQQCPAQWRPALLQCATSNADHTQCCRQMNLDKYSGGRCMSFCNLANGVPKATAYMVPCLRVLDQIKFCYKNYMYKHQSSFL